MLVALVATAQQMPQLPVDPDVRIGKLDNGLTYYIRYNNWPEDRADFFIAQKVGSIQEEDNQRGLAHFLEHMCFNGTKNFPGNEVVRYCESIGVQFGRDLNAYTSIDETVYNISNVPTTRQSSLDSCLLILHDWSNALLLETSEIDKERAVIHEEWRVRLGAQMRMLERCLPTIYPGCKYGYRLPIGTMDVVDNFPPQALIDYYHKWYHPGNQAIIVVGDINVDYTENKIKEMFGHIRKKENADPVVRELVPDNAEPIVVVEKDKEQRINLVQLMFKHDPMPEEMKNTPMYLVTEYANSMITQMLNARIEELSKKADCPFIQAGMSIGNYLLSSTKNATTMFLVQKDGMVNEAVAAAYREALRAARHGFTATEYQRAKADYLSSLEKVYSNKDKRYTSSFCREYAAHFTKNEPIPSLDVQYMMMKQIVPSLPVDMINEMMKEYVSETDSNLVVLSMNIEKEGAVYPVADQMLKAIRDVRAEEIAAYVDNVKNEPLIPQLPQPGTIAKTEQNDILGYKTITLSNGVKVVLKQTDFKKDQVLLEGECEGGQSLFGEEDFINLKALDDVIGASGLGNFSATELEKALAGKIASAYVAVGEHSTTISGSSTPTDVETLLQLVWLYFNKINKDQEGFDNLIKQLEVTLKNKSLAPQTAFSDSMTVTMTAHNPRFTPITMDELKHINYDRCLEMAAQLFTNAQGFTFTIIGNYDEATLLPLLERYLGSLRSTRNIVRATNIETTPEGVVVNSFKRKMETPQAFSIVVWHSDKQAYTLENRIKADMAGQILDMVFTKKIREEAGATYSCMTQAAMSRGIFDIDSQVLVYCPLKPEKADLALQLMRDELEAMAKGCDEAMFIKVKEYMQKAYVDRTKQNSYWNTVIDNSRKWNLDIHTDYLKTLEAQTPASVCAFVKELLSAGNRIEVVMLPE